MGTEKKKQVATGRLGSTMRLPAEGRLWNNSEAHLKLLDARGNAVLYPPN